MKTLVIGPSWVGDMMMSQSLYRTLKQRDPHVDIDVMAPCWCLPLLNKMPEINHAIEMPLGHGRFALKQRYQLGVALRQRHYKQAIVLPNSFKSALIPYFANIPKRTGWRGEMRYGLLNDWRTLNKQAWPRMVERYVALAYDKTQMQCATDLPEPLLFPQLSINDDDITQLKQQFSLPTPLIGFCPGAEFGPAKRWPHYHYGQLAQQLIDQNYTILLLGSIKDQPIGNEILALLPKKQQHRVINLAGKTTLEQAVDLIAACRAIISNDSGLMHIAAALNKPLIALYGPSSPDFTPPLSDNARVIRLITGYHRVRKGDAAQGYHQSLHDIRPDHVFAQLMQLIEQVE